MATNYGVDTSRILDRALVSTLVTNPSILIGQWIARAWQTAKGALAVIGDDPNYGLAGGGIVQYVNRRLSPNQIAAMQSNLEAAALYSPEVLSISVSVSFTRNGSLTVTASGQASTGPFALVGNVSSITGEAIFDFMVNQ